MADNMANNMADDGRTAPEPKPMPDAEPDAAAEPGPSVRDVIVGAPAERKVRRAAVVGAVVAGVLCLTILAFAPTLRELIDEQLGQQDGVAGVSDADAVTAESSSSRPSRSPQPSASSDRSVEPTDSQSPEESVGASGAAPGVDLGDDGGTAGDSGGGSGETGTQTGAQPEPDSEQAEPAAETQTCGSCGYTLHTASDFELRPKWRITGDTVEIASDWRGTSTQGMEHNLWVFVVPEGGSIYSGDQVFERKWEGGFVSGSGGTPWYTVNVALDPGASYAVQAIAVPTAQGDSYWSQGEVPVSPAFTY